MQLFVGIRVSATMSDHRPHRQYVSSVDKYFYRFTVIGNYRFARLVLSGDDLQRPVGVGDFIQVDSLRQHVL